MSPEVKNERQPVPARRRAKRARTVAPAVGQDSFLGSSPCHPLAHTDVYRLVPPKVRGELDAQLLARGAEPAAREQIMAKLGLAEHGVTLEQLAAYAAALEELARPVVTSQVMAAVLGCLPRVYRRRLLVGSEVLLISRVLAALSDEQNLSVPELGRLAAVIRSLGGSRRRRSAAEPKPKTRGRRGEGGMSHEQLARSVRLLYGLELKKEAGGEETGSEYRIRNTEERVRTQP